MASWVIYDKTGLIQRAEVKELEYSGQWMGERYCIAKLSSSATIPFEIGDYITFRGEKFFLSHIPTVKKVSSFQYDYELRLDSLQIELEWVEFRDLVPADNGVVYPTPLEISFTGSVKYLVERIQACLDAFYGEGVWTITIGVGAVNEEKNISISNASCWDALTLVDTEYNLKFFISGRNITISGNPPEVDYTFEYGKGNGLYEIERVSNTDKPIVTKLRVYGSTRNLDASYLAGESWNTNDSFVLYPLRLMLPSFREDGKTDYILTPQSLIDRYGIREASVVFDDIYPTIKGVTNSAGQRIDKLKSVTPVTNNEAATFEVTLNNLGFDLVDSFTTETPQLSMKTGTLQGYTFNIQSATLQNDLSWKLVLERNTITEGDTGNFTVPNIDLNAKAEDEFVLLGITMPQTYIDAAEEELYDRGEQYLSEFSNFDYIFKFNIEFDEIFLSENQDIFDALHEGSDVRILDTALHQYTTYISISSLSITYDESGVPKVTVTLDDNPQASSLEQLEGQVSNMGSTVANGFKSNSALSQQYKRKLDKSVWDSVFVLHYDNPDSPSALTSIESKVDFWTNKAVSAGGKSGGGNVPAGVTKLSALEDVSLSDLSVGQVLQYNGEKWVNANAAGGISSLTVNLGTVSYKGVGTTDVVVNLPAYPTSLPASDVYAWAKAATKPSYVWSEIGSKPTWIGANKPSYAFSEITDKPTTISGYSITDAYTKQTVDDKIAALQSVINAINSWFTLSDGTLITTYNIAADGEVSAGGQSSGGGGGTGGLIQTVYGYSSLGGTFSDNNKNDTFNAYTINTLASRIGVLENTPSGIASLTVNLGTTPYAGTGTTDVTVNLPAYPTTLPASDVYAWAKQPTKPSYTFSEIGSKPTTLSGYGITDAYTKTEADGRYLKLSGGAMNGDITMTGHALVWHDQTAYDDVPTGMMGVSVVNDSELGYSTCISFKNYYGLQIAAHGAANKFYIRGYNHTQWNSWYQLLHTGNIGSFALTPSNYTSTLDTRYLQISGEVNIAAGTLRLFPGNGTHVAQDDAVPANGRFQLFDVNANCTAGGGDGYLLALRWPSGNYVTQIYADVDNTGAMAIRHRNNQLVWGDWYTIWNAANDGPGSGLNADLLDGHQATDLSRLLSYIDSGTKTAAGWYRVFTASSDRTNAGGVNIILHLARSFTYTDNEAYTFCISVAFNNKVNITQVSGLANERLITKIRVVSVNSGAVYVDFYLSQSTNGNTYYITGSGPGTFQAATAVSTVVGNVTEFTTVNGCKSSGGFSGALSGNASSATKLATAHTLWGQSFNGTANVSGLITADEGVQIGPTAGVRVSYVNSYLSLESQGNEMCIGGNVKDSIFINYRNPSGGYAPAEFLWKAGSSSSWANFSLGSITANGNISATGEVSAGNASDRRLKKDITTLSEGETAHVLSHLNPVSFTWNAKAEELSGGDKKGIARSFVADEFLSLLPNAGRKMWDDYDAIYTEQVVPYVVKGWQMHERRLSDHERRIEELEKENRELKRQLRRVA